MSNAKVLNELENKIAAAKRQKRAIECRTSFIDFVKYTMPDADDPENIDESMFKDAKHHRALARSVLIDALSGTVLIDALARSVLMSGACARS